MATEQSLILNVEEFKHELVNSFNETVKRHKIPAYFMEPIVANIYNQVAAAAQKELEQEKSNAEEKSNVEEN